MGKENGYLKISKNTVVHCPTEELANRVLKIAHNLGYEWRSGESYLDVNYWGIFLPNTCYCIHRGEVCSIDNAKIDGYTIMEAEEFIVLHETK